MRTQIFRHLDRHVELFGLSFGEVAALCVLFAGLMELLGPLPYGRVGAAVATTAVALLLRAIHRWAERNYIRKLIRFTALESELPRELIRTSRPKERAPWLLNAR